MYPMCALRQTASSLSLIRVNCVPITSTSPSVTRSIPASRFSNVDLPEPLGPINARKSPSCNSRSTRSSATISKPSRLKRLVTLRTRTIGSDIVFHPQTIGLSHDLHRVTFRLQLQRPTRCHSIHRALHRHRRILLRYGLFAAPPCYP